MYRNVYHSIKLWIICLGSNIKQIEILQKRTLRMITNSSYIAHACPLCLLNVEDMFWKILNFYINYLSICCYHILNSINHYYFPYYFLRLHHLPLTPTSHVYADSGITCQLVYMKNNFSVNNKIIMQKIIERSHSLIGFSKYVTNIMLEKYEYECTKRICRTCSRL